jgi:hypothetical protein
VGYEQFSEFLAYNVRRAMELYRAGRDLPPFRRPSQERYVAAFRHGDDAKLMRAFARSLFGEEWADRVLFAE